MTPGPGADLGILRGGGGVLGRNSSRGGGVRVQVHGIFIYWQANKKKPLRGGGNPPTPPPPGSATADFSQVLLECWGLTGQRQVLSLWTTCCGTHEGPPPIMHDTWIRWKRPKICPKGPKSQMPPWRFDKNIPVTITSLGHQSQVWYMSYLYIQRPYNDPRIYRSVIAKL